MGLFIRTFCTLAVTLILGCIILSCSLSSGNKPPDTVLIEHPDTSILSSLLETSRIQQIDKNITVTYPYHKAVFPPEISAPVITWQDEVEDNNSWLITIEGGKRTTPLYTQAGKNSWHIEKSDWEKIKKYGPDSDITFSFFGFNNTNPEKITSRGQVSIEIAPVGVQASILYRQVPLPFPTKDMGRMKWRLGDIASYDSPKIILEGLQFCASCHTASHDGKYLSMEMNYGNDSGAQFIVPVTQKITLTERDFFSWNEVSRPGILPKSRGLFGRMSPSGKYAMATVNELSLALLTNDRQFSQVFFPTYGILAHYSCTSRTFAPLPGADDFSYVHTNPDWSPDESHIVFARAKTKNQVHDDIMDVSPKFKDEGIHSLNKRYNIQFDLYRIPFNHGKGGKAIPLKGANSNSMSNYFPRHSPDGKWIVYTQSKTGIMLQPDSQLFILPSSGGEPRKMRCNRELFNSWHSWSPNSRWLLFSSKVNTPFTEIFLTYIDENGMDYPPVLLSRFSDPEFAANVPEFVNFSPAAIDRIVVR